jgi:hypothetical protein
VLGKDSHLILTVPGDRMHVQQDYGRDKQRGGNQRKASAAKKQIKHWMPGRLRLQPW